MKRPSWSNEYKCSEQGQDAGWKEASPSEVRFQVGREAKPGKQEGWRKTPNLNAEFLDYHIISFKL